MTRTKLITELADDIACGDSAGKFNAAFFLDTLMDNRRVTADDVAVLLCMNEFTDAHTDTQERVQRLVRESATEFFTNSPPGKEYVDERMAELERDRQADAEFERKYGAAA